MNLTIRFSCATQRWLLLHPNLLTRALLTLFYTVEVIVYSIQGARTFLTRRAEVCGRNFASLGRLVVGEYDVVAEIIDNPQRRGSFIGRGRMVSKRLPKSFLLFLSDEGAGGDGEHRVLHDYIWSTLIAKAQERVSEPDLADYIDDLVQAVKAQGGSPTAKAITPDVQRMVIRYMMRVLFDFRATEAQVKTIASLFYTGGPRSSFILSALKPLAPPGFLLGGLHRDTAEFRQLIEDSPALQDYVPSADSGNLSKEQYCLLLMSMVGIAALGGGGNLAIYIFTELPPDYPIDLDDHEAVERAVLETARRHPPVNNVNVILDKDKSFEVGGRSYTFPAGTVVAGSIGLASLDPAQFPDPTAFKPDRENLASAMLSFNSVGYYPHGNHGLRTCPGRNVAIKMCGDLLVAWRKATTS